MILKNTDEWATVTDHRKSSLIHLIPRVSQSWVLTLRKTEKIPNLNNDNRKGDALKIDVPLWWVGVMINRRSRMWNVMLYEQISFLIVPILMFSMSLQHYNDFILIKGFSVLFHEEPMLWRQMAWLPSQFFHWLNVNKIIKHLKASVALSVKGG